jgi:hypothetical protein
MQSGFDKGSVTCISPCFLTDVSSCLCFFNFSGGVVCGEAEVVFSLFDQPWVLRGVSGGGARGGGVVSSGIVPWAVTTL